MRQIRCYYANLHTYGHYKISIILVNFDNLCTKERASICRKGKAN